MDSKKTMVLVVGAPANHLDGLRSSLESLDCDVLYARGLFPCVRSMMDREAIPVVFFDLESSAGSYPDLLDQLRESPILTRIVVTSRKGDMGDYLDAMQFGAYDYLANPFDRGELARILHNAQSWLPDPSQQVGR